LDMSTYRVEPDGMSGFRVVQTLTGGHRGRIVGNFPTRRAAEAWAEIQSEIEVSEAQPPVPEGGRGERRSDLPSQPGSEQQVLARSLVSLSTERDVFSGISDHGI
jgi:hypothetical protein